MGFVKEQMFKDQHERELIDFLKQLLEQDELNPPVSGISKSLIDKGIKAMSEKQMEVINRFVKDYTSKYECERCSNGNVGELTDYIFIRENGLCPMCEGDRVKFMEE